MEEEVASNVTALRALKQQNEQTAQAIVEVAERIGDVREAFDRARRGVAADLGRLEQDLAQHVEQLGGPMAELAEGAREVCVGVCGRGSVQGRGCTLECTLPCCHMVPAVSASRTTFKTVMLHVQEELRTVLATAASATREDEYKIAAELVRCSSSSSIFSFRSLCLSGDYCS